ncbi:hypothetical protein MMC27_001421 [Xylographa pallens]|nr:hypothetical protein [Xylographa pallens]
MARKRKHTCEASELGSAKRRKSSVVVHHPGVSRSHPVLSLYYAKVYSLRRYLLSKLPASAKSRRRKIASVGKTRQDANDAVHQGIQTGHSKDHDTRWADLLDSVLVGVGVDREPDSSRMKDFEVFSQRTQSTVASSIDEGTFSQHEIVNYAISSLFNKIYRQDHKPSHILCHGYQRVFTPRESCDDHNTTAGIPGLLSLYPNAQVASLKDAAWSGVLKRLGKAGAQIMLDLILDHGLFVEVDVGRDNFYQLSGVPLSELPILEETDESVCKKEATKNCRSSSKIKSALRNPNSISFVRNRMMHARSALNARGEVQFGLRHIHVLNRYPNYDNLEHTIQVTKHIFPRQFKLHNVFTSLVDSRETSQTFKDYTLREEEIALAARHRQSKPGNTLMKSGTGIPRRVRGSLLTLVAKLQRLHSRCSYVELLKHYCHIDWIDGRAVRKHRKRGNRRSGSDFRGNPLEKRAQRNLENAVNGNATSKSSITAVATPAEQVSAFCRAVLLRLIPFDLWGEGQDGEQNKNIILHHVNQFISLRQFENMNLHSVSQNLKIRCIAWLAPPKLDPSQKLSKSDREKRREIFLELLYYVFDSIIIPLIRANFHVTESNAHGNKLFFFRHDLWRACTEPSLSNIKLTMFEEIQTVRARRLLDARTLGFSQTRLLPKANGLRLIMNLRQRATKLQNGKAVLGRSINSVMAPVFNMLSYEKSRQPDRLGSALFSVGDLYPKIKAFRAQLLAGNRGHEFLYFAKVDVQSCFDTIPQRQVVALMEKLCSETEYRISRHAEIKPSGAHDYQSRTQLESKPARKFVATARAGQDYRNFQELLSEQLGLVKRSTVFVDSVVQSLPKKETLLELLREHVERNVVKIGKKFFRQKQGIPQGSVLSSLICNFFYAEFEKECLDFLHKSDSLLLRLIDDFLLITTNHSHATRFIQIMHEGNEKYGINVRADKSLTNFESTINAASLSCPISGAGFPYCGAMINTVTLEITKDRTRRMQTVLADSLTVETSKMPGRMFYRKAMNSFKIQTHAMFLDTSFNSQSTVFSNIYQNLSETAMKYYRYAKAMGGQRRLPASLLMRTIQDLSKLALVLIESKHQSHNSVAFKCSVSKAQIEWLVWTAFRHVLGTKQSNYQEVIAWLDIMIKSATSLSAMELAMLRSVARQGNITFANYKY